VAGRFVRFWASGGAKFPKMGYSLLRMSMNRPAKFDAASFIFGGEIRNRTNTHIHTHKQKIVTDRPYLHLAYRHVWITRYSRRRQTTPLVPPPGELDEPQNLKCKTYCTAIRGRPSNGIGNMYQKIW